ncbi:PREDICTED: uncharacterized protein LOC101303336 [Fragaria vesca subsp. vesca]
MGDYHDILSLTRILVYGPKSKADVDSVMESKELEKFPDGDDEQRANLMDMGFKALGDASHLGPYLYCTILAGGILPWGVRPTNQELTRRAVCCRGTVMVEAMVVKMER